MSEVITIKLNSSQQEKLYEAWQEYKTEKIPPYAKWQLRPENCVITCYTSDKTVFQGKDANVYAAPFMFETPGKKTLSSFPQAGSDEVGTGDYFGPVCVCATYVDESKKDILKEAGVRDSKQLTDDIIRKIAPEIMKQIPYSLLILDNATYNRVHDTNNMNAIKAKLHNQAYVNLAKKVALPKLIVIDQFTPEKSYYRYIAHEKQVIRGIHFETKAEDKYQAVGAASVIARYAFLVKMDEMEEKWHITFQKGAGSKVDDCARQFVKEHGREALNSVAKVHFKNTEKI